MELLSGAEMVVRFLRDEGVKHIYGYPGGALLHVYDALFKEPEVEHILVRHEKAATHMADGYARATGKVGVASTTCGPGFTQIMTALTIAARASVPLVVFAGDSPMLAAYYVQQIDMAPLALATGAHYTAVKSNTQRGTWLCHTSVCPRTDFPFCRA